MYLSEPLLHPQQLPEDFIQYLWKNHWFVGLPMFTTQHQKIQIIDAGRHNTNAQGADFSNAKIVIDGITLHGDIEIHKSSKQWYSHGHFLDDNYNKVVLHVILETDQDTNSLKRADGTVLPELHLSPYLQQELKHLWHHYKSTKQPQFPCEQSWHRLAPVQIRQILQQKGESRLFAKSAIFGITEDFNQQLWATVLKGLGYAQNATPMEHLANKVMLSKLQSLQTAHQREALLLGTAGLLPETWELQHLTSAESNEFVTLNLSYEALKHRFGIGSMNIQEWKLGKIRPANSPFMRLKQASYLFENNLLFDGNPLENLLDALYHYQPQVAMAALLQHETHPIGKERINTLLVNALLPALLFYATDQQEPILVEMTIDAFSKIKAEQNNITKMYRHPLWHPQSAQESQGLMALHQACKKQLCQQCPFGKILLTPLR